jgi:hypothetical protein
MNATPLLLGIGLMMMSCSSVSIASIMMGSEEKKSDNVNDTAQARDKADKAQAAADAIAADPNSTPSEVAAAQAKADAAQAEADATPPS